MLNEETKSDGKMELISVTRELMPGGKVNFKDVIKYPMIKSLADTHGENVILKNIFLLVKDFCSGINVVRNMSEDQMIDAAAMLLDECENFRLEDYVMMFSMAKKGELFEFKDRLDLQVITKILDNYWIIRKKAGDEIQESGIQHLETMGPQNRTLDNMHPQDAKMLQLAEKMTTGFDGLREVLKQDPGPNQKKYSQAELLQIQKRDTELIRQKQEKFEKENQIPPKTK